MSRSANQKLKLLYLEKILKEKTDDEHYITMPEILDALATYGIEANRKSIYTDMDALEQYGITEIQTLLQLIEDYGYSKRWEEKKKIYAKHGIVEGYNLIVTKDSLNGAINSAEIKKIVDRLKEELE